MELQKISAIGFTASQKTKLILSHHQLYGNNCKQNKEYQSDPMNFYAISKQKAENIVIKLKNSLILRVNFVEKGTANKGFVIGLL